MRRGFYRTSLAWYTTTTPPYWNTNEILFGLYGDDGKCDGEMGMRWHDLGASSIGSGPRAMSRNHVARLECFEDAFLVLAQFGDVIERLAQTQNISEPEFANVLLECGFTDLTQYKEKEND
ncbi:MAG: hypothetical protein IPK58_22230 [Acidobacteria bacterium]|nr:hypothetical protein [Acidobacteriota bacterium]